MLSRLTLVSEAALHESHVVLRKTTHFRVAFGDVAEGRTGIFMPAEFELAHGDVVVHGRALLAGVTCHLEIEQGGFEIARRKRLFTRRPVLCRVSDRPRRDTRANRERGQGEESAEDHGCLMTPIQNNQLHQ
jgi:hypothetical protein